MELVKITEDLYLNPSNIKFVEFDNEDNTTRITMVGGDAFLLDLPIKKVLDAISGSEEYRKSNAFIDEKGHLHNSHFKTNS
ncbi:hypothetical protein [Pediococcus pentosaceus]|uniref:hypothetical protein n=1 Tax=Pediococcus pentosaceus TaxID=1255 RepID=UPI0018A18E7C|nr:hypothetical protein [Pediococcus pentosaceus]MBF7129739.1 hypothetical protein [Pediococcus pentosaceus]